MALRAVVVGGGLGGMAAAVALMQAGIDVQVYEQAQQLTEVGAGVSLAAYEGLRRDRTARVQLGSRRQGAGWDSSGSQLIDRRWIYEYDAWTEAAALT